MAASAGTPIYELPQELLLQIAFHLPDSDAPRGLKNLCLVSRRFRVIAQEVLHATAKLMISCGCHPKVNPLLKLLRTLFDRPDLALKLKVLRIRTVRKNVAKLCAEQHFSLEPLRTRSLAKLGELGYTKSHPWHRTILNSIESGFAGLLLIMLPNLIHLDFWVKDHHRGPPSGECISGLFGGMTAPDCIINGWCGLQHLTTSDTHVLKSGIHFDNLTSLDLKTISIGTILRLNGPASLQGTENLQDLALTVSIQFMDRLLIDKAEIQLSELFEALDCGRLRSLKMMLINDGYHIGDDLTTQLDAGYFIDQLDSIKSSIETLAITLETTEDETELEWLLDMITQPRKSLKHFTALKQLVIPHVFLFVPDSPIWAPPGKSCRPKDLPPQLETLEILYPDEDVKDWALGFIPTKLNGKNVLPNFRELTLTCRDEIGVPAAFFITDTDKIWWTLSENYDIETYAFCQITEHRMRLAELWLEGMDDADSEDEWSDDDEDEDDDTDEDDTDGDDDDDEMPDLIDPTDDDDIPDHMDSFEDMPDLIDTTDATAGLIDPMD